MAQVISNISKIPRFKNHKKRFKYYGISRDRDFLPRPVISKVLRVLEDNCTYTLQDRSYIEVLSRMFKEKV